jgi:hypothetical protein
MIRDMGLWAVIVMMILLITTGATGIAAPPDYIGGIIGPGNNGLNPVYHAHYVAPETTSLFVNLTWSDPTVKLVLTIHKPDGSVFGTYSPAGGPGAYKTQIAIFINNSQGLENGKWGYLIDYKEGTTNTTYRL